MVKKRIVLQGTPFQMEKQIYSMSACISQLDDLPTEETSVSKNFTVNITKLPLQEERWKVM